MDEVVDHEIIRALLIVAAVAVPAVREKCLGFAGRLLEVWPRPRGSFIESARQ